MVTEGNGASNGAQNETRLRPEETTRGRRPKRKRRLSKEERVALIGAIAAIVAAFIAALLPPVIAGLQTTSTPIDIPIATPTLTSLVINTPTYLVTQTLSPTSLPSLTLTPTITLIPTDTATIQPSPAPVFIVHLVADKTTGRSPLIVKFDARDSIFHESNGTQFSCRAGTCYYTWRVYSGGQPIGRAENNTSGRFEYTFRDKGAYTVTVYICRGQDRVDCGSSAAWIQVAR